MITFLEHYFILRFYHIVHLVTITLIEENKKMHWLNTLKSRSSMFLVECTHSQCIQERWTLLFSNGFGLRFWNNIIWKLKKTVDVVVHSEFKKTCQALNLLEDEAHWNITLEEAVLFQAASKMREAVCMIAFGYTSSITELLEKRKYVIRHLAAKKA